MSKIRKAIREAVRTVVETLEERRLLTTVGTVTPSFAGTDQHLTIPFSDAIAGSNSAYSVNVQNLSTGNALAVTRTAVSTDGKTATFQPTTTPIASGWYEAYVNGSTLTPEETETTFGFLNGDFDQNGVTDFNDFMTLQTNYGATSGKTFADGDANYDHAVDFNDYLLMQDSYGQSLPALPTQAGGVVVGNAVANALDVGWAYDSSTTRDGFKIYRSTDGVNFTLVKTLANPTATAWRDDGSETPLDPLVVGQKYWYRVRSYTDAAGASAAVTKASAIVTNPTAAPTNLFAAGIGPGRVALKWTPSTSSGVVSYRIYRSENPNFLPSAGTLVTATDSSKTKIIDSGISTGHIYWYRIVAIGASGSTSLPSLAVGTVAQNNLAGISNGGTPFNPATHDSDTDGTVDAVDTDNDNDGITDEADDDDDNNGINDNAEPDDRDSDGDGITDSEDDDDDGDGIPDSYETDENGDGIPDEQDPASGNIDIVPSGAGTFNVFNTHVNGSEIQYGTDENGNPVTYTPSTVNADYAAWSKVEDEDPYDNVDTSYYVPKRDFYGEDANGSQTITLTNLPKHSLISVGGAIYGRGFETDPNPNFPDGTGPGQISVKVNGEEIEPYSSGYGLIDGGINRYSMVIESTGDTMTLEFSGTNFDTNADGSGGYWYMQAFGASVMMPEISITADTSSISEAGNIIESEEDDNPTLQKTVTFTVRRNPYISLFGDLDVPIDWGESTAHSGDVSGMLNSVHFNDGDEVQTITVTVADNQKLEWARDVIAKIDDDSDDFDVQPNYDKAKFEITDDEQVELNVEGWQDLTSEETENGVQPYLFVDGERLKVDLSVPQDAKEGATIGLIVNGAVSVYENEDDTTPLSTLAWEAGEAPETIYVGANSIGSFSMQVIALDKTGSTQPARSASTQGAGLDIAITGQIQVGNQATPLWYFGGENAANYNESLKYEVVGLPFDAKKLRFSWTIPSGSGSVDLQDASQMANIAPLPNPRGKQITGTGRNSVEVISVGKSNAVDDVKVKVTVSRLGGNAAKDSREVKTTVYAPDSIQEVSKVDQASGAAYQTIYKYKVLDQFGNPLPSPFEVHEEFVGAFVSDYANETWTHQAPNGVTSDFILDTFGDGPNTVWAGMVPSPVNPNDPQAGVKVDHATQQYWVGSTQQGKGIMVDQKVLQFYRGKARRE